MRLDSIKYGGERDVGLLCCINLEFIIYKNF